MAYYTSYGAAGEVTGSCHYLEIGKIKILIDCGMFQGKEEELNFEPFLFEPKEIDYLIITHAHLDHIGRIPLLVKNGFKGDIISTKATFDITRLMLKNAAAILETKPKTLYTLVDVEPVFELFNTCLEFNQSLEIAEGITVSFKCAGHILGAVSVKLEFEEDNQEKSVVFSGDIGQKERVITSAIDFWDEANYIFLESTYGDQIHESLNISIDKFKEEVLNTINHGGTVVIPSFALERTQEILYILNEMSNEGQLNNTPVFLDSPLAINVTKTFLNFPYLFNEEVKNLIQSGDNPFEFKELTHTYTKEASQQINNVHGAKIIIAGSGMCEGGRVSYHLLRYLGDEKNLVLFVGYQVRGTLGRRIISTDNTVEIFNNDVKINARIEHISGFSAHADQKELIEWTDKAANLYCIYLIHGDIAKMEILKKEIKSELKEKVHIVKMKERIYI